MTLQLFLVGLFAGRISSIWASALMAETLQSGLRRCQGCGYPVSLFRQFVMWYPGIKCQKCFVRDRNWPFCASLCLAVLFVVFGWLLINEQCQTVSEVRPSLELWRNRLPFHLIFIFLLATATITDFLDYVIPDPIVMSGVLLAVVWATVSGELQTIHVWVNWDYDLVALYGPYLPEWMKQHQHVHGFVWSMAGLISGASIMWAGRIASHRILGIPAIGLGDVTLMAMIGAFMGWQPTLCVLAIAPLVGIVLGVGGRIITGRSFVAFGPYLCIAAYIVLCIWRLLWEELRLKIIFSHWPTIAGMIAGSFVAFCILLAGLRIFRATPIENLR